VWAPNRGGQLVGSLVLGPTSLTFEGRGDGREMLERVRYADITSFELDRSKEGRIAGRASLLLTIGNRRVRLGMPETGALPELVEHLSAREAEGTV